MGRGVCEVQEWTLLEEEGTVEADLSWKGCRLGISITYLSGKMRKTAPWRGPVDSE